MSGLTADDVAAVIDDPRARASVSAVDLTTSFLERIAACNPSLNAVWEIFSGSAISEAAAVDRSRATGQPLPLDGLPMLLKDNIDVAGHPTTLGAGPGLATHPTNDAPAVAALRRAGAVLLGKAAMHELAFGATSDNEHRGPVRNPWSLTRSCGGSSGGSGGAVAADMCIAALGTDTGGSVRIPAALCGVSGLRPTFGSISGVGLHPTSWTFDTIGPLTRSISDLMNVLTAMNGQREAPLKSSVRGLRIGIARGAMFEDIEAGVADAVRDGLAALRDVGAQTVNLEVPGAEAARAACTTIIQVEASAVHEPGLKAHPEAYGVAVRRRLELGRAVGAVEYAQAQRRRGDWAHTIDALFDRVDVIATATTPSVAPLIEGAEMISSTASVVRLTYPWSYANLPAISIPCGFSDGLPVGLQLIAPSGRDRLLLDVTHAYQLITDHHRLRPTELTEQLGTAN